MLIKYHYQRIQKCLQEKVDDWDDSSILFGEFHWRSIEWEWLVSEARDKWREYYAKERHESRLKNLAQASHTEEDRFRDYLRKLRTITGLTAPDGQIKPFDRMDAMAHLYLDSKEKEKVLYNDILGCNNGSFSASYPDIYNSYLEVIHRKAEQLRSCYKKDDLPDHIERLTSLQMELRIPLLYIEEEHLIELTKCLESCLEIESEVNKEVYTVFHKQNDVRVPSLTRTSDAFFENEGQLSDLFEFEREERKQSLAKSNSSSVSSSQLSYEWLWLGGAAIYASLKNRRPPYNWRISQNDSIDQLFNLRTFGEIGESLLSCDLKNIVPAIVSRLRQLLEPRFIGTEQLEPLEWQQKTESFANDAIHVKCLLHLFFPFFMHGVLDDMTSYPEERDMITYWRSKLDGYLDKLEEILANIPDCTDEYCQDLSKVTSRLWEEGADFKIGHVYHFYDHIGGDSSELRRKDLKLLRDDFGDEGQYLYNHLKRSPINALFQKAAEDLQSGDRINFARKHWEEFGFIIKDESPLTPFEEDVEDIEIIREKAKKLRGNFEKRYRGFRALIKNWQPFEKRISTEADALIEDPDSLAGSNLRLQLETLKNLSLIERHLIGRRVILARARKNTNRKSLALMLKFVKGDEENEEKTRAVPKDALPSYLYKLGLKDPDYQNPFESDSITEEEKEWLEKHRGRGS